MLGSYRTRGNKCDYMWRNWHMQMPSATLSPPNTYQDIVVITLQTRNTIEGRNPPNRFGSRPTITQFPSTWENPGRTVTWNPSNVSFPGEETAGTIGCYLCGKDHYMYLQTSSSSTISTTKFNSTTELSCCHYYDTNDYLRVNSRTISCIYVNRCISWTTSSYSSPY